MTTPVQCEGSRFVTLNAQDVRPERIEWLVPGRIPTAGVTLLVGDPGLGKSMLTTDLAARASRCELDRQRPFALMISAEDALAPVVVPRLQAAGAELSGVAFIEPIDLGEAPLMLPDDASEFEAKIAHYGPCLVTIDPLSAFIASKVNSWRDQSIRLALRPLHAMAERHRCAIVIVAHLNKSVGVDPLYRTGGSVGIPAAARSALLLARDPDDPDGERGRRRILAHFKSNYGLLAPSLSYEIESVTLNNDGQEISTACIRETGESDHGAHALLARPDHEERTERDDALDFLRVELADGARPAKDVKREARDAGISDRTLARAKAELAVESQRVGGAGGAGHWEWSLTVPALSEPSLYPNGGTLSGNGSNKPGAVPVVPKAATPEDIDRVPEPNGPAEAASREEEERIAELLDVPLYDDGGGP